MRRLSFVIAALAGLLGATGVGAAAAAAHVGGGQLLETAATFLMIHSAAVLAVVALAERASRRSTAFFVVAGLLLIAGMVLFCGDFSLRALAGRALFPMAAPAGGILLIAGWLAAATAARWPRYPEEAGETRPSRVKLDNKRPTCLVSINSHGSAGLRGCPESNMALPGDRAEKGGRILIVEDEPFIALTLEDMLSELGFTVAGTVAQVPEALAFLQAENPIDAALLDVNIGSQKIDPVADLLAERACPFVFTTGYGRSGVPAAHNTRAVVQKPFRLEEIAAALQAEMSAARERPV